MHPQNSVSQSLPIPADVKENKAGEASASSGSDAKKVGDGKPAGASAVGAEKTDLPGSGEKKITSSEKPAASSSNPTTTTSTAARSTNRSTPKKKKRSGLSGFFLRMGCLSADEFEDPEPKKGTAPAKTASKPASTTSAPVATPKTAMSTKEVQPVTPTPIAGDAKPAHQPEVSGATGTNVVETGEKEKAPTQPGDEVVVAPKEPTTLPDDEVSTYSTRERLQTDNQTAGLTSSAVQAPGSGSALLATSSSRRQSDASPENEKTDDTSGGYSNISESEIPDESSGAAAAHAEGEEYDEEYEDEEDRLIAQGGMGIPVDEVGLRDRSSMQG